MLIASYENRSEANGPGARAVLWLQGCDRQCPGCCNPEMQSFEGGENVDPIEFAYSWAKMITSKYDGIRGLTLSGGEPLHPSHHNHLVLFLDAFCEAWGQQDFDIMAFTGYTKRELNEMIKRHSSLMDAFSRIDMLIAGPYDRKAKNPAGIVASTNQDIIRYSNAFDDVDDDELLNGQRINEIIMRGDHFVITGIGGLDDAMALIGEPDHPSRLES